MSIYVGSEEVTQWVKMRSWGSEFKSPDPGKSWICRSVVQASVILMGSYKESGGRNRILEAPRPTSLPIKKKKKEKEGKKEKKKTKENLYQTRGKPRAHTLGSSLASMCTLQYMHTHTSHYILHTQHKIFFLISSFIFKSGAVGSIATVYIPKDLVIFSKVDEISSPSH